MKLWLARASHAEETKLYLVKPLFGKRYKNLSPVDTFFVIDTYVGADVILLSCIFNFDNRFFS